MGRDDDHDDDACAAGLERAVGVAGVEWVIAGRWPGAPCSYRAGVTASSVGGHGCSAATSRTVPR